MSNIPKPNKGQHPHFMRDTYGIRDGFTPLDAVWTGVKVMWWPRDGRALVVMPTDVPSRVIRMGLPFYPVPAELRVLIPKTDGGNYVPGKGMQYKDVRDQVKKRFWVSMHTADPYHILIDWNPGSTLGPEAEVALHGSVIDVPSTGSEGSS